MNTTNLNSVAQGQPQGLCGGSLPFLLAFDKEITFQEEPREILNRGEGNHLL